jgi:prevent-host-death family protein
LTSGTEIGTIVDMKQIPSTLSASRARSNFYTLLEEVANKLRRFTITRRGEAKVVLMHPDEVASWEETMDILADKKLVAQILKSEKERKLGETVSEKELFEELGISSDDLKA